MHIVIAFTCSLLYSVTLPAYSMCWPVLGLQRIMLQTFQMRSKVRRSLPCSSAMSLELMDSLYLPSLPLLSFLDGLKPYYCNKFSFETFDVINVWLLLCYKSSSTVHVSITNPGMTLLHRGLTVWCLVATQLLAWNRGCAWWEYFVWWKWSMA